jgi:hypothetical protein
MFQSCKSQGTDNVIKNIDKLDLSILKGMSIHFRSKGYNRNTNIYFVNTFQSKCSPYIVEVQSSTPSDMEINNDLVLKSCGNDYLDNETIKQALIKYLELSVCLISIDDYGNVYVNPSKQERATLLKKVEGSIPKDFDQFEHYKGNWYIRK